MYIHSLFSYNWWRSLNLVPTSSMLVYFLKYMLFVLNLSWNHPFPRPLPRSGAKECNIIDIICLKLEYNYLLNFPLVIKKNSRIFLLLETGTSDGSTLKVFLYYTIMLATQCHRPLQPRV